MPSAISSPSDPVGTVSTSIVLLFLPSRMIEPLPKARSIWESAASSAFVLSIMLAPSTTRNVAGWAIATLLMAMILRADNAGCGRPPQGINVHYLFLVRNIFFLGGRVLAPFHP